jgi:hypothetical protein
VKRWFGYPIDDWDATKEHAKELLRARAATPNPTIYYSELGPKLRPIPFDDPHAHVFRALLGDLLDASCPRCDTMLAIRSHPTIDETQAAAEAGDPRAIAQLRGR